MGAVEQDRAIHKKEDGQSERYGRQLPFVRYREGVVRARERYMAETGGEEQAEKYSQMYPEQAVREEIAGKLAPGPLSRGPEALSVYRQRLLKDPLPQGRIITLSPSERQMYKMTLDSYYPQTAHLPEAVTSYNPSSDFINPPRRYRMKRIEDIRGEDSVALLHVWEKGKWVPVPEVTLPMQDPFAVTIGSDIIVGGVATEKISHDHTLYWTQFYKGASVKDLSEWVKGPSSMKDIRASERFDPRNPSEDPFVDIYTRPLEQHQQGAGPGKIGHMAVKRSEFLSMQKGDERFADTLANAPLLPWNFAPEEWGGVNQSIYVTDRESPFYGMNVLLIHQAFKDPQNLRHYIARILIHDPVKEEMYDRGIVGEAKDFPTSEAKRDDLIDIFFPTTLRLPKGRRKFAVVEGGLRDTSHGAKVIYNPLAA